MTNKNTEATRIGQCILVAASTQWARVCAQWRVEGPNTQSPRSCKIKEKERKGDLSHFMRG